jgi:hypothetical protein
MQPISCSLASLENPTLYTRLLRIFHPVRNGYFIDAPAMISYVGSTGLVNQGYECFQSFWQIRFKNTHRCYKPQFPLFQLQMINNYSSIEISPINKQDFQFLKSTRQVKYLQIT